MSGEDVRGATFPQALRGYDRQAVHDLLDRVADWMEGKAGAVSSSAPAMRDELAKVGEKTAGILTAAEEAARSLRDEAVEYAERLRADAEEEARKSRLNASQKMDEMIAQAEEKAQRIIDDAVAQRRHLNQAISSLIERREEIAADASRLAEELLEAVEDLRKPGSGNGGAGEESAGDSDGEEGPTSSGDEDSGEHRIEEQETQVHPGPESEETEAYEADGSKSGRRPTLLVDPDEED